MKRFLIILCTCLILLSAAGCANKEKTQQTQKVIFDVLDGILHTM